MRAERGIVDTRRERQRYVERTDRAGHETAGLVRRLPREPRAREAHLVDVILEPVVRLADRGGRERVRRGDVGAGREVPPVDVEHDLGPGEVEQVGIAGDVAWVILEPLTAVGLLASDLPLDEHAPRPVEHGDALAEDGFESCARVLHSLLRSAWRERHLVRCAGSLGV